MKTTLRQILITFAIIAIFGLGVTAGYAQTQHKSGYLPESRSIDETDVVFWTMIEDAPEIIQKTGSAVIYPYWYLFGGQGAYPALAYNLITEEWQESTYPPVGSSDWTAVETDTDIYLIGRFSGQCGNEFQRFTPTDGGPEGTWTQLADYPIDMCGAAAAWDGGSYIYAAGGANGFEVYDQVYRYDISDDRWISLSPMPIVAEYQGGAFVQGKFYCVGGTESGNTLLEYNPASDNWAWKANAPQPIYFAQSCVTTNGDYLITVGGGGGYYIWPVSGAVQLYDPLTDTWIVETPLPEAIGINAADYVGGSTVMSTGGWVNMVYTYATWEGVNFPGGTPVPSFDVEIDLSVPGPITIPANGGSFNYDATLTNHESGNASLELWILVRMPDGTWSDPLFAPPFLNIPGSANIERNREQTVPGYAPAGDYLYEIYIGDYPYTIWDSDSITFSKSAVDDGGVIVDKWLNSERSNGIDQTACIAQDYDLITVYPNPFNPSSVLSYKLQAASKVNLSVHDISGRLVTELVNGWRDAGVHQVTFDGSGLASGVYLYRLSLSGSGATSTMETGKMVLMK